MLVSPGEIRQHLETAKISHGVCGFWFDQDLAMVPRDGCQQLEGKHLLHVGIAQPGPPKAAENRLWRSHLRGRVRGSTLRLSLAALLADRLALTFFRDTGGRVCMARTNEEKLTDWLERHAALSVAQNDDPWALGGLIFATGPSLPLSLIGSTHPFGQTLRDLRRALGGANPAGT